MASAGEGAKRVSRRLTATDLTCHHHLIDNGWLLFQFTLSYWCTLCLTIQSVPVSVNEVCGRHRERGASVLVWLLADYIAVINMKWVLVALQLYITQSVWHQLCRQALCFVNWLICVLLIKQVCQTLSQWRRAATSSDHTLVHSIWLYLEHTQTPTACKNCKQSHWLYSTLNTSHWLLSSLTLFTFP